MIRIKRDNLNALARQHYINVESFAPKLTERLEEKSKKSGILQSFYKQLFKDVKLTNGESLLISTPEKLEEKIIEYTNTFGFDFSKNIYKTLRRELQKVFDYNGYAKEYGYWLAKELNVNVCPYCNRQYTFTISHGRKKIVRPEFDHFYNKKSYPYLSLSFYNLIPSCSICNRLKGFKDFSIKKNIHPYLKGFTPIAKFETKLTDIEAIWGDSDKIELLLNTGGNPLIKKNAKIFKLEELYNGYGATRKNNVSGHRDYVIEIIQKRLIYNSTYIDELFETYQGIFFKTREDTVRLVLSNYVTEDGLEKRVLSKLTKDINEEWGLI
ncbi:MAG: hypothetical protein POELPBGB_01362 [Bacteroidia bacterium]|nr:hypothetical protein [Bacteroidia bacterium]